jgi:hypothetical protein
MHDLCVINCHVTATYKLVLAVLYTNKHGTVLQHFNNHRSEAVVGLLDCKKLARRLTAYSIHSTDDCKHAGVHGNTDYTDADDQETSTAACSSRRESRHQTVDVSTRTIDMITHCETSCTIRLCLRLGNEICFNASC